MHPKELRIQDYTYNLPDDKIAKFPLAERDASKLLVYKNGSILNSNYSHIADNIPEKALMVFNQTKVVHARLLFYKPTGGAIELFCLSPHNSYPDIQIAMQQKGEVLWECMVGGASKWKPGTFLEMVTGGIVLKARIVERNQTAFIIGFEWSDEKLTMGNQPTFAEVLHIMGKMPIPPYFQRDANDVDDERYQTVFAKEEGSVAAPTAGLHFTDRIFNQLAKKEIETAFVTLHVSAGTFKPVKSTTMQGHEMHEEWIVVEKAFIRKLIENLAHPIIAVGTTSLRTLESLYWIGNKLATGWAPDTQKALVTQWEPYETLNQIPVAVALGALMSYLQKENLEVLVAKTQILIAPGYRFKVVKGLVTNFHQPESTLLLLVAAFIGEDWRKVYSHALQTEYRFLSYGDGCLLWPKA